MKERERSTQLGSFGSPTNKAMGRKPCQTITLSRFCDWLRSAKSLRFSLAAREPPGWNPAFGEFRRLRHRVRATGQRIGNPTSRGGCPNLPCTLLNGGPRTARIRDRHASPERNRLPNCQRAGAATSLSSLHSRNITRPPLPVLKTWGCESLVFPPISLHLSPLAKGG